MKYKFGLTLVYLFILGTLSRALLIDITPQNYPQQIPLIEFFANQTKNQHILQGSKKAEDWVRNGFQFGEGWQIMPLTMLQLQADFFNREHQQAFGSSGYNATLIESFWCLTTKTVAERFGSKQSNLTGSREFKFQNKSAFLKAYYPHPNSNVDLALMEFKYPLENKFLERTYQAMVPATQESFVYSANWHKSENHSSSQPWPEIPIANLKSGSYDLMQNQVRTQFESNLGDGLNYTLNVQCVPTHNNIQGDEGAAFIVKDTAYKSKLAGLTEPALGKLVLIQSIVPHNDWINHTLLSTSLGNPAGATSIKSAISQAVTNQDFALLSTDKAYLIDPNWVCSHGNKPYKRVAVINTIDRRADQVDMALDYDEVFGFSSFGIDPQHKIYHLKQQIRDYSPIPRKRNSTPAEKLLNDHIDHLLLKAALNPEGQ